MSGTVTSTLNTSQMIPYTLAFFEADGTTPAPVQAGSVVGASSDETVLTVVPSATDQTTGFVRAVAVGVARVTFTADADLAAGTTTITVVTGDVTVTQDPATLANTINVTFGAPVPKA